MSLAAIAYYEKRRRGLGERLGAEVEHAIAAVIAFPGIGGAVDRNARRLLLSRTTARVI
jgi:hypothetical protein